MKSTGICRKIDELGRVVLPIELRRSMGIEEKDPLEIFVEGDSVILRKQVHTCIFCGSEEGMTYFKGKPICDACRKAISKGE